MASDAMSATDQAASSENGVVDQDPYPMLVQNRFLGTLHTGAIQIGVVNIGHMHAPLLPLEFAGGHVPGGADGRGPGGDDGRGPGGGGGPGGGRGPGGDDGGARPSAKPTDDVVGPSPAKRPYNRKARPSPSPPAAAGGADGAGGAAPQAAGGADGAAVAAGAAPKAAGGADLPLPFHYPADTTPRWLLAAAGGAGALSCPATAADLQALTDARHTGDGGADGAAVAAGAAPEAAGGADGAALPPDTTPRWRLGALSCPATAADLLALTDARHTGD